MSNHALKQPPVTHDEFKQLIYKAVAVRQAQGKSNLVTNAAAAGVVLDDSLGKPIRYKIMSVLFNALVKLSRLMGLGKY